MFEHVLEGFKFVFDRSGLFHTVEVVCCGSRRIWLSSMSKVVVSGKMCVDALVVLGCVVLCCVGSL